MATEHVWTSTSSTDASSASNYQGGVPSGTTGANLTLNGVGTANITSNLGTFTNVAALTIKHYSNYTGNVGVEMSGTNGATYLAPGTQAANVVYLGLNDGNEGNSVGLFLYDGGAGTNTAHVFKTGSKSGAYPVASFKGNVDFNVYGGEAGFCVRPGETGTTTSPYLKKPESGGTDPVLRVGAGGVISGTARVEAGTLYSRGTNTISTLDLSGQTAEFVCEPDCSHTFTQVTLTEGASMTLAGGITVTAATVGKDCTLDGRDDRSAKTMGLITAYAGAKVYLDNGDASTWTPGAGTTAGQVTISCPDGVGSVEITAPAGLAISIV